MRSSVRISGPRTVPFTVLRLRQPAPATLAALGCSLAIEWPSMPNACTLAGDRAVAWLAPGEWALVGFEADAFAERCSSVLGAELHHVADLTDAWTAFSIEGDGARDVLAQLCSLDLHPRHSPPPSCAQTKFAGVYALLLRPDETRFDVFVDRSLAHHVERSIAACARAGEYFP